MTLSENFFLHFVSFGFPLKVDLFVQTVYEMYGAEYQKFILFGEQYQDVFSSVPGANTTTSSVSSAQLSSSKSSVRESSSFCREGVVIDVSRRSRSRNRKNDSSTKTKGESKIANRHGAACSFDEAVEKLKHNKEELVQGFKEAHYKKETVNIQQSVYDRFYVPMCEACGFDIEGLLDEERINTTAAFLSLVIPQSAAVYLAHIKAKIDRGRKVTGVEKAIYCDRIADLKSPT